MTNEKEAIKAQLLPLMDNYTPIFAEHGVKCSLHFRRFDQPELDARSPKRRLFDDAANWLRRIFSGKSRQPENKRIITWCVILRFSPTKKTHSRDVFKDYSFVFRYNDKHGTHRRNISKAIERELKEKQQLLRRQKIESIYTDNWWDIIRYVCGNYWYKETAKGINLDYLRLAFLCLIMIFALAGWLFI